MSRNNEQATRWKHSTDPRIAYQQGKQYAYGVAIIIVMAWLFVGFVASMLIRYIDGVHCP